MLKKRCFLIILSAFLAGQAVYSRSAAAACRNPNLVLNGNPYFRLASASEFVDIQWFGHAFFQITSSKGTKVITDPFGPRLGYPMPEVWPHAVTVGRDSGNHSNVDLASGNPLILRGLKAWGNEWNQINTIVRDVLIYNVPIHTRALHEFVRGTAFVFELDGLCICHSGDVGEPFNEDQLDLLGHVDVLFVPIGGSYTMGPENAKEVIRQLKPKIAVPMHYYNDTDALDRFLNVPFQVRFLQNGRFRVSRDTLPAVTEIYVPKVTWFGRDRD